MNLNFLEKLFNRSKEEIDELCEYLKLDKKVLESFEENYKNASIDNYSSLGENHFGKEVKGSSNSNLEELKHRIVDELISETEVWEYDGNISKSFIISNLLSDGKRVSKEEIISIEHSERPMLTGDLMKVDINANNGLYLLKLLRDSLKEKDPNKQKQAYNMFRQGLDILDLDGIIYSMLSQNKNSMGYWLPKIVDEVDKESFFKIPKTIIIKVPMTLLQLTRLGYEELNRTTLDIVNEYCYKIFKLKENEKYFVKTGTYSSKFDFRNALVKGPNEVKSLGEYLLFIHTQALGMAHYDTKGTKKPIIYGVSTTNEWVVREFIEDKEDNLTIYHGLPLHTEYRVFVDFDSKEILGIHEYWEHDKMTSHFEKTIEGSSKYIEMLKRIDSSKFPNYEEELKKAHQALIDAKHDLLTFKSNYEELMKRYNNHKDEVCTHLKEVIKNCDLTGQWSIDIMQNDNEFYIIDMQQAQNSTYYKETVREELRTPLDESWVPSLSQKDTTMTLKRKNDK